MKFLKAQGLGNDFMMVDVTSTPEYNWKNIAIHLSNRHLGIGFDQLILFKNNKVWFYNSDGSSAENCGNGTRCLAYYLMKKAKTRAVNIETPGGVVECSLNADETVSVKMPYPSVIEMRDIVAQADLFKHTPVFVRIGNPHLVCFVDNLEDIHEYGPILARQDVNVQFVRFQDSSTLNLKTWERGSGLTHACGSGSCASVVAAHQHNLVEQKVCVKQEGGDLHIEFDKEKLLMTGAALIVYEGDIDMESQAWAF